jgi:hypothetical protein
MAGDYPEKPGWRASSTGSTSREAALSVRATAPRHADLARAVILEKGSASPEEITSALESRGHKVLLTSIRARCTQMHKLGELRPSGSFAKGESGRCRTIRWAFAPGYPRPAPVAQVEA